MSALVASPDQTRPTDADEAATPIRVLVTDDHPAVRAGLSHLLETAGDIEVVGQAGSGEEAVDRAADDDPDLVLMDLSMPGIGGAEATRQIMAVAPRCRVVILTSFSGREGVIASLDAGAAGFLLKDAEPTELLAGIRAAARGESPLAPSVARVVLEERGGPLASGELTRREREILALLPTGTSNKAIAGQLGISAKTVKAHLCNIFRRIGAADRFEAALWARRHGLDGAGVRELAG